MRTYAAMALTDDQRGPRASYLNRHVKRFGSGDAALKKLAAEMERLGFSRSWSTYKGWVSSDERSPIPPEAEPYFLQLFGEPVPPARAPAPTQAELIAALHAQTKAISDLAGSIQALLGLEDRPATSGTRRAVAQNFLRTLLDEAEASGSAEGDRRAQEPEDPERPAPSPARRTRGIGAGRG